MFLYNGGLSFMKQVVFVFLLFFVVFYPLSVKAMDISQDQLAQFQQLSDAEKQKLMHQFSGTSNISNSTSKQVTNPEIIKPRTDLINKKKSTIPLAPDKNQDQSVQENKLWPVSWDKAGLKKFGYDLFAGAPTTFAPVSEIPVPYNYTIGPGDEIVLQIFGQTSRKYNLVVTREGLVQIPDFGPVNVTGMTFDEMKSLLINKIKKESVGADLNISLGNLRSMKIFVLGDAYKPGSYTISALSTLTNALFVSGGIKDIGSLRNIKVKRGGKLIESLDLYDFLIKGNMKNDIRLMPGDVIFVPTIGDQIGIKGAVKRPGVYELKNEKNLGDIISLSGGLWNEDKVQFIRIYRTEKNGIRICLSVDINNPRWKNTQVQNGDLIDVASVEKFIRSSVSLRGNVFVPGIYKYSKGLTLKKLIPSKESLKNNTDLDYGLILREKSRFSQYKVIFFSPKSLFINQRALALKPEDRVFFFSKDTRRYSQVKSVLDLIKNRNNESFKYPPIVELTGNLYFPGFYPVTGNATIKSIVFAGGGFKPDTDIHHILIERKNPVNGKISVQDFDFEKNGNESIKSGDKLYVFSSQDNRSLILKSMMSKLKIQADNRSLAKIVTIKGQIKFPGEYPLSENMSVKSLIDYAGGFRENSFTRYVDLIRYYFDKNSKLSAKRFNIFFSDNGKKDGYDFKLKPGDKVVIKEIPNWNKKPEVKIEGEVNFPGTYFVEKNETITNLIAMAGGLSDDAFLQGSIFMREELKKKEKKRYESYIDLLSAQLGTRSFKEKTSKNDSKANQVILSIIERLKKAKVSGRLIINLPKILRHKENDIVLKDGDILFIPDVKQEVTVMGEVYSPMSHLYNSQLKLFDYIDYSGGFTESASVKRTYIIRANGRVVPYRNGTKGFFAKKNIDISPGDTIVVPYDVTAISSLVLWGDVTKILYQMSTSVAALSAVGVF